MNQENLMARIEEIEDFMEKWVGVDYLNALTASLDPEQVSLMIIDAAKQPLFSTRHAALLCTSVIMNANLNQVHH